MVSDNEIDNFDYYSDQDYSDIDEKITLFEFRLSMKNRKTKQKNRKPSCSVPVRTLKSLPMVIKDKCKNYTQTPKALQKSFRYVHYPKEPILFECDRIFQAIEHQSIPTSTPVSSLISKDEKKTGKCQSKKQKSNECKKNNHAQINSPKKFTPEQLIDFSTFRRHFYQSTHHLIKSSFDDLSFIKINNIRLASVNKSVQNYFMNTLRTYSYFPQLVYHGTEMNSIKSILQYGLLIPYQQHPTIPEAPIIGLRAGQVYGNGIYCNQKAFHALEHTDQTNTLLVCAALPKRHGPYATMEHYYGDILVLKDESRIIPIFLLDVIYQRQIYINYPWFDYEKQVPVKNKKQITRTDTVSRKYLRKVLNCMNDETRKNDVYQIRQYESVN